ncbi:MULTISPECIES: VTT domain-containing protein [Actinotignum]|uniref:VTT domain-containing protein n=1 Tax=Actinotignum TaxID=1653174 RepID=UPI00254F25AB|nr:VTT domain-containing protein [Actinotignum schaalii]MDK7271370.1 VTT domain-containing protein [Actinotignum schaalii]
MDSFSFLAGRSFAFVYLFFFLVVSLRSSATFWLGRYAAYLVARQREPRNRLAHRAWAWAHDERVIAASQRVARRGWPLVTLCFFTIGVQTVILIGAGLTRMSGWRFTLAALPGWLGWAAIYSTVGMLALRAVWAAIFGNPWGIAAVVVLGVVVAYFLFVFRTGRDRAETGAAVD